ncbi:MAG: DUF4112 domain-containing protein [Blastopirellula sp. JB062]
MRRFVDVMENAVRIPGTRYRVGLDSLLGLIPGIGDFVTATAAFVLLWEARRLGIPLSKRTQMVGYIFFDMLIGIVPLAGDLFDAAYKSNTKILDMIEAHIAQHGDQTAPAGSYFKTPKFLSAPVKKTPRQGI